MNKRNHLLAAAMGIALCAASSAFAGSADSASATTASSSPFSNIESGVKQWWNGNSALANWGGLGYKMEDYGLKIEGEAKETFMGQISGGLPNTQKGNWVNEVKLRATYDFAKKLGIDGLTLVSNWRYRNVDGSQDSPYVAFAAGTAGPSSMFNPNKDQSGMGVRIMTQFLQWQSEAGKDPRFMVKGGWVNPYEDFLQQPDSKWFQNNAIASAKGIGGANGPGIPIWSTKLARYVTYGTTSVPWSSSYAAWGGSLRAKPSASTYIQTGLYLAIGGYAGQQNSVWLPTQAYPYGADALYNNKIVGTVKQPYQNMERVNWQNIPTGSKRIVYTPQTSNNHGFNFQGAGGFNPNGYSGNYTQNGLYNVNEIGWTPKLTQDKLAGKYALGGYIWGQNNSSYSNPSYRTAPSTANATAGSWTGYGGYSNKKAFAFDQNQLTWGLYLQADQRLTAVHNKDAAPVATGKNPVDSKNPVAPTIGYTADKIRGLYMINEFSFTPPQNNAVPFYFQTGLVYKGLLDARKNDTCGIVLGAGFYSTYLNSYTQTQNQSYYNNYGSTYNAVVANGPTSIAYPNASNQGMQNPSSNPAAQGTTTGRYNPNYSSTQVIEAFYNVQVNKWLTFRPDAQWINNPAGNATVPNVWILGAELCAKF